MQRIYGVHSILQFILLRPTWACGQKIRKKKINLQNKIKNLHRSFCKWHHPTIQTITCKGNKTMPSLISEVHMKEDLIFPFVMSSNALPVRWDCQKFKNWGFFLIEMISSITNMYMIWHKMIIEQTDNTLYWSCCIQSIVVRTRHLS